MKFFKDLTSLTELRKEYRRLAFIYHPYKGGDTVLMQNLNDSYYRISEKFINGNIEFSVGSKEYVMQLEASCLPQNDTIPLMPKFGMRMQIPDEFVTVNWYGRGQWEKYPDRKSTSLIGNYESKLENFITDYLAPQDNANRCDVRWYSFSEQNGRSFKVTGLQPHCFRDWPYTEDDLEKATNPCDLHKSPYHQISKIS